jgi:hypothetical protein
MRYTEINLFDVYVAPIAPMIVVAWALLIPSGASSIISGCCVISGTRPCFCSPYTFSCCR